ncbi:MFS transporter [Actinoplanes utahensis]|nr:MFS transporter [Actinoplanes utahensis]
MVRRWSVLGGLRELSPVARLLVLTQLAFNVGFFLVLPFLAGHLGDDLGLAGATVGLVLGVRTFSQQGLFVLGGTLADRYGTRPLVLTGCALRVAGFLVLGYAGELVTVLAGVVLTGLAAALFSPAVEAALAREGARSEATGGPPRSRLLAMFAVAGEIGAVTGPVLGTILLAAGFRATCLTAAAVFVLILALHARLLPREPGAHAAEPPVAGLRRVLRHRRFLAFAAAYSAGLVAYNQLYPALPAELERAGHTSALGWLFALASAQVVLGQTAVTEGARRLGARRALTVGFAVTALAFAPAAFAAPAGLRGPLPAVTMVVLLTCGQMLITPVATDVAARLAGEQHLGAHLGVLSTAGGLAVLIAGTLTGGLLELVPDGGALAVTPWAVLALIPAAAATAMWMLLRPSAVPYPGEHVSRAMSR